MIIITGATGFIGSNLTHILSSQGKRLWLVDWQDSDGRQQIPGKESNLAGASYEKITDPDTFIDQLQHQAIEEPVEAIFHMGACSDTTEDRWDYLLKYNVEYSKTLFKFAQQNSVPFFYASSAATYGDGDQGFADDLGSIDRLKPLNLYGKSKHEFDLWMLEQPKKGVWAGFKFFNVYGEREDYKGHMASKVHKAFIELQEGSDVALFRSSKPGMEDGGERRDFVYSGDVAKVLIHFLNRNDESISDIYNLGTGKAQSFLQLAQAVFAAKDLPENIRWIDMPEKLKGKYQYFTQADITKLREKAGYAASFSGLEKACVNIRNTMDASQAKK